MVQKLCQRVKQTTLSLPSLLQNRPVCKNTFLSYISNIYVYIYINQIFILLFLFAAKPNVYCLWLGSNSIFLLNIITQSGGKTSDESGLGVFEKYTFMIPIFTLAGGDRISPFQATKNDELNRPMSKLVWKWAEKKNELAV